MRIGVFDSGIGGLFVLKELINNYPNNTYYYFGDNINIPYGTKSKYELKILSSKIIDFLITKEVDRIIIACGTISSNIYQELKEKYNLPIYDIISPTIEYLNNSDYKTVGILATEMTIKSNIFNKINKEIYQIPCPKLVPLIENNLDYQETLDEYLKKLPKVDTIVLGCTHYPFFEDYLNRLNYKTINMGKVLCEKLNLENNKESKVRLYFSKINHDLVTNIDKIIKCDYQLEELCLNYQK